jgi:DNA-binding transcriptional ArsR family regulator
MQRLGKAQLGLLHSVRATHPLSLPGSSRQSMFAAGAVAAMDPRNKSEGDTEKVVGARRAHKKVCHCRACPGNPRQGVSTYFHLDRNTLDAFLPRPYLISMKIEIAASQLESLGNPTRLQIYRALVRAGDEGMPVGHLQQKLEIAGSTLSHHIKSLIATGLVTQERQATTLICRAHYPAMHALVGYLVDECCLDSACLPRSKRAVGRAG